MQYPAHPCHGSGTATHRGAGQFILYGAGQDDSSESSHERLRSAYQKAVPGATYYLTNSGDTTHTFLISGSNLSDVSKLTVEGGTLVTDSLGVSAKNGVYTVTGVNDDVKIIVTSVLIGDVNLDGAVAADDATAILQYVAKLATLQPLAAQAADANQDGAVAADDSTAILRYIAKLDPKL